MPPIATDHAFSWVAERARKSAADGLRRRLRHRPVGGDGLLDLASNDYLGLARHPEVIAGAVEAATAWGAGSTGSRLVTGSTQLHARLESELAGFVGTAAGLVFSSGYLANLGTIAALVGPGDLVVSDALNHASIIDACRLSRARVIVTAHRDVAAVEAALAGRAEERALVVTDAVFSVDGDLAPLPELHAVARRHRSGLLIDDAHAFGVLGDGGRGAAQACGLEGEPDVVLTVTLSKSLGAQGGVVLASCDVVDHVVDAGRAFVFDTGLAPACAGAALAALHVLQREVRRPGVARRRARELAEAAADAGLTVTSPAAAVAAVLVGAPDVAVAAAATCAENGVRVGCFRPPSVPDGVSRLRLTARVDLTDAEIDLARRAMEAVAVVTR